MRKKKIFIIARGNVKFLRRKKWDRVVKEM